MDIYDSVQKIIETMERTSSTMKREIDSLEIQKHHKIINLLLLNQLWIKL